MMRLICLNLQEPPTVRLKLKKPKKQTRVVWTEDTVDNEGMNKKKSKCTLTTFIIY